MSVELLFEKKFSFSRCPDWTLPPVDSVYVDSVWNIPFLMQLKRDLNETKSLLNDKGCEWQKHTSSINRAGSVIGYVRRIARPEILTQAWCKFYEVLASYDLVPSRLEKFTSFHLCEAPGAFVSALNYFLCTRRHTTKWRWFANTLNPYYEGHDFNHVVVDDRLLLPTLKRWLFGEDNTGDVTDCQYFHDVQRFLEKQHCIYLITADGSFSCTSNPGEQESLVSKLHFAEILIALRNLATSGTFVIKKFTFFECVTVCQMYILNCLFSEVNVFKPVTSKAGNSEVYVVCLGYLGSEAFLPYIDPLLKSLTATSEDRAVFPQCTIPESFLSQIQKCAETFVNHQRLSIEENLSLYQKMTSEKVKWVEESKMECAEMFVQRYQLMEIPNTFRPLHQNKKMFQTAYGNQTTDLRLLNSVALGETFEAMEKMKTMAWKEFLLDFENRVKDCFGLHRYFNEAKFCAIWKHVRNAINSNNNYKNWIITGKKLDVIQNSKFCNPVILFLWNQLSYHPEVKAHYHEAKSFHWNFSLLESIFHPLGASEKHHLVTIHPSNCNAIYDPILDGIVGSFQDSIQIQAIEDCNLPKNFKIMFVNTTLGVDSCLHQETKTRKWLAEVVSKLLKVLNSGDDLILCLESVLTRFTVGILFIILSFFNEFLTLTPVENAPAGSGQIWVFHGFQLRSWRNSVLEYLEHLLKMNLPCNKEILEIVPISVLCGGYYHKHLLNVNSSHLLQRLYSLINIEKSREKV